MQAHIQETALAVRGFLSLAAYTDPAERAEYIQIVLQSHAARPEYGVSIGLAGVLASRWAEHGTNQLPLFGIGGAALEQLLAEHFPGAARHLSLNCIAAQLPAEFDEALELADLVDMLIENRTTQDAESSLLAHAIATACLGENHLWQDMCLPSRQILSNLFEGFFHPLALRNHSNMKWKKFLYKQLCERAEIRVCKAPQCGVCSDYQVCFGPEA